MLDTFNLAYLHISEPDWAGVVINRDAPKIRQAYRGVIIGSGGYSAEKADNLIRTGLIDAVAFGRGYIANPDLVERFSQTRHLTQ